MSGQSDKGDKMYIQDENQKIVGNLPDVDKWGGTYDTSRMWTNVVIIPQIGAFVTYEGESYVITRTITYQEQMDSPVITTMCRITRIDDEGDMLPIEAIEVFSDELTLI